MHLAECLSPGPSRLHSFLSPSSSARDSDSLTKHGRLSFQRGKRVSKVRVLQKAIDYIRGLRGLIAEHDGVPEPDVDEEELWACLKDDSQLFAF